MTPANAPYDLAVVGAGAAGLATAIATAEQAAARGSRLRIVALDGARKLGAKILVAGGGRCNVSHVSATAADYYGDRPFISRVLKRFSTRDTVTFFAGIGVPLKEEETGKLFPTSDSGRTVLHALLARAADLGVEVLHPCAVSGATQVGDGTFRLEIAAREDLRCRSLVLATGGMALPKSGSDGNGYSLAKKLGHRIVPAVPALVPLLCGESEFCASLAGLTSDVVAEAWIDQRKVASHRGSLLFTHFGVSGPAAMDISRVYSRAQQQGVKDFRLTLNFFPGQDFASLRRLFLEQPPGTSLLALCRRHFRLPRKLVQALEGRRPSSATPAAEWPSLRLDGLSKEQRGQLLHRLVAFDLPVSGQRGWHRAETTAGGVPLTEVKATMESKCTPGLYLVGEILDCDGRIGGFSFQWAWSTAHIAGGALMKRLSAAASFHM